MESRSARPYAATAPFSSAPSRAEQLTYASGEIASNLAWNMVGGFLLFYYTDVVLLPVAALGTLMLASRILDAVFDPIVGILVDRTRSRWGQARPYLLFASIPFGLLCVLTFAVPDLSSGAKLVYAYVTFTLLGLCYSLVYIPYGAMQPMVARDPGDKVRIGSWRAMGTSIASIVVYALVLPIAGLVGGDRSPLGFTLAAVIFSTLTVAIYLTIAWRCKERYAATTMNVDASRTIGRDLRQLLQNPPWILVVALALITFARLGTLVSTAAYFCKNVLGSAGTVAILLPLLSVAILAGGSVAASLIRRFGVRAANIGMLCLSITLHLVMPYATQSTALFMANFMAANLAIGVIAATVYITCTDAVEYQQQRFGVRTEGLIFSSVSFGMKVGMALGAALTAFALAAAGYDPNVASEESTETIGVLFYYVPVALMLVQILCFVLYRNWVDLPETAEPASLR